MTIDFDADGAGHCLYGEDIDLQAIGTIACRRASHVEFNRTTQKWEVLPPDGGRPLFSATRRSHCIAWEKNHLHPAG